MESWNKPGLFLFILGFLLVIYPYPNDFVFIEDSHRIHGNLFQHFGVGLGLSAIVTSISIYTEIYRENTKYIITIIWVDNFHLDMFLY